ncbi:MAG: rod shape-determining protein MreC [Eubacteriales bacterium]|nr:rod shape-determining protein MreC [Eubacteriales bacterium]MDD4326893.1 rod shape-determining protein MreC [Eubacteriales bacterium]MDD4716824.1 rod shape-determining protein MreC [Eubacteriales bacterium]NCU26576.1 rod shape-determining protein MreC [Candidatus Nomurabacteria bacterium]
MENKGRRKIFVIAIITLLVCTFILFSSIPGSPLYKTTGPVSLIADPVQKFVTGAFDKIEGFISSIKEGQTIRDENKKLQDKVTELEQRIKELEENGRRWQELKEAFSIKELYSDYDLVGASILTRELGDWFDVFRVSVGTRDGITVEGKESYAVVDAGMHLVGRVYAADISSAKILPVLNESSVISAKLNTAGGSLLRVRGDILLKEEGLCLIDSISDFASLSIGDEVITSGAGGLFPPGLPIGIITAINDEGSYMGKSAFMKVYADYRILKDVFIMKGKVSD